MEATFQNKILGNQGISRDKKVRTLIEIQRRDNKIDFSYFSIDDVISNETTNVVRKPSFTQKEKKRKKKLDG